jgi:AraC family transcriptional regulator, regulatory protein of adaptative response / DNA-3-methyladenine glycosylase II
MRGTLDPDADLMEDLLAQLVQDPGAFPAVEDLARSRGLGASRLRELCIRHAHLPPAQLLLREQVRRAARLLVETPHSLADVGRAAGFRDAAAFSAQFLRHMGLTPSQYRNLGPGACFSLPLPPRFRAQDALAYHGRDAQSLSERVEGPTLLKAQDLGGPLTLELRLEPGQVHVRVHSTAPPDRPIMAALHARVRRMLGLDEAPEAFERGLDPAFRALAAPRKGLRIPLTADVWESLVWAILGQQVNLAFAYALRRDLVARFGVPAPLGLRTHPTPQALAGVDPGELQALRLSGAKAGTLVRAAQAVLSGELPLEAFQTATRADARLRALKGIGPWTAQYVLMRGCGFADCVPVGDAGLTLALQRHFHLDHRPGPTETQALLEPYAPHRSLAVFHLWASLSGAPT